MLLSLVSPPYLSYGREDLSQGSIYISAQFSFYVAWRWELSVLDWRPVESLMIWMI